MDRVKEELKSSETETHSSVLPDTFWEILEESALDINEPDPIENLNELSSLLSDLKLDKYEDKLTDLGIRNTEDLKSLSESDLDSLGIPLGHKLKLLKKIKELIKQSKPIQAVPPKIKEERSLVQMSSQSEGISPNEELNPYMGKPRLQLRKLQEEDLINDEENRLAF